MPLTTLHTRLTTLLAEARFLREASAIWLAAEAGGIACDDVVFIARRLRDTLTQFISPAEGDTDLVDYAAAQFAGFSGWVPLDQQIAGVKYLVEEVVAAAGACLPADGDGYLLKDKLSPVGVLTTRRLTTADTGELRAALQSLRDAIPE